MVEARPALDNQGLDITLDKSQMRIRVKSNGEIQIEGSRDVKIKAGTNLSIEAGAKIDMKAPMISIQGSGPVTVKGTPIQLN